MTDVDVGSSVLLGDFALEGIILAQHVWLFTPDEAPNRYFCFYSRPLRGEIIELHLLFF